ncbi:unnamed protein product, partial [Mesorhabditis belari]|uniref:VWFA domain-containing protein n=1 Tax=Mesorhabditis belari TaxID=2138241 RepID=A0AAF3EVT3_9BILA
MEKSRCFFVKTANMAFKYFLLLAFFFISAHGTSEQFACNAQDVIFIFDTKTSPRSLDDWRALAGDFLDKFNMRADGTSIYARFAAIQFGWDTAHPSTSWYTSPFPSQDNASIVFRFDDYYARSDVKRVIDANVDENLAPNTAIGGALVDATNIFTNQLQNNRTPVIILFTNGLAGETDQSEALSQASILRGLLQVDIWVVLAQDVTSSPDYFGLQLTGNKTNQLFNSTSDAYSTDGIFSAFGKKYPCATPTSPPVTEVCPCTINKSWNDVMILADGSDNMGNDRFTQMWGFIVSALGEATIGQQIAYQTRVGVVVYGNNATLFAPLNKYQSTDQFLSEMWPFKNEQGTNILAAVLLAVDEFKRTGRPKSRKVMIIGASTYREGSYKLPLNDIETFQRNQGVVIVIDDGNANGQGSDLLQQMASKGFYIDATQGAPDFVVLQKLLCNANCFCPGQGQDDGYYPVSEDNQAWPSGGCFWDSTLTSIKTVADTICRNTQAANGSLGQPKTQLQQRTVIQFNTNVSPAKPPFFIGLTRQSGNWIWADGSYYDANVSGEIIDKGGDCAVVQQQSGFNVNITSQGCTAGAYYTCQTRPCTTDFYCV